MDEYKRRCVTSLDVAAVTLNHWQEAEVLDAMAEADAGRFATDTEVEATFGKLVDSGRKEE